jgi:hypothetical protein
MKRSIRQDPETAVTVRGVVGAPSPTPLRSASDIAAETGDFTEFDRVIGQFVAEISGGRRRHRPSGRGPTICSDCGHPLVGSVRPDSHGRPCMTLLGDGLERCQCEGPFQPEESPR